MDFSPASIRYARDTLFDEAHMPCTYHQADVRDGSFGKDFDLVMMLYGQFNVFPRDVALKILKETHAALKPGGSLLLEVQSLEQVKEGGEMAPNWYSARSGLFSGTPHLVLQENFWHSDVGASTTRFMIIDARTGDVSCYALSNEAYTVQELTNALRSAGFIDVKRFPSLTGKIVDADQDLPVVVARR